MPIIAAVLVGGRAGAFDITDCPLMYRWHGTRYLGAANGLAGILQRNTIYARVDSTLRRIRETSAETIQAFAAEYLKTPLGEPVKGKREKSTTKLWLVKFYKKTTNVPEPFPHELVDRLEKYLDGLEEQLVDMSSLLYDHRLQDAFLNSADILQSAIFTQQ
ncbi:hypothetical protein K1719_036769 [Acacia pycnantha]|nr:hypothetical protein K1719_047526 [Acacia pycnantha]KAI9081269.1 hypothetical protein K1719_036769 [Acacia pycnantha]